MTSVAAKRATAPATPEKTTRSAPLVEEPVALAVEDDDDPVFEAVEATEEILDPAVVDAGLAEDPVADVELPPRGAVESPSISLWTVALKVPVMLFSLIYRRFTSKKKSATTKKKKDAREFGREGKGRELGRSRVLQEKGLDTNEAVLT